MWQGLLLFVLRVLEEGECFHVDFFRSLYLGLHESIGHIRAKGSGRLTHGSNAENLSGCSFLPPYRRLSVVNAERTYMCSLKERLTHHIR